MHKHILPSFNMSVLPAFKIKENIPVEFWFFAVFTLGGNETLVVCWGFCCDAAAFSAIKLPTIVFFIDSHWVNNFFTFCTKKSFPTCGIFVFAFHFFVTLVTCSRYKCYVTVIARVLLGRIVRSANGLCITIGTGYGARMSSSFLKSHPTKITVVGLSHISP